MESQIVHHDHHAPDHDHHGHGLGLGLNQGMGGGGGEEDGQHPHEKKSVLKKVKAKARKIKDTITKHGHGHDLDHEDEEDDDEVDDDEVMKDPEIHGAPLYEGCAMRSRVGGQGKHPQDVGIGMPTGMHNPAPRETTSRPSAVAPNTTSSLSPSSLEKDPHAPTDKTDLRIPRHSEVKVADPAGRGNAEAEAAGESQVFDSFAKMKVKGEHEHEHEPNRTTDLCSGTGESEIFNSFAKMNFDEPNQGGVQSSYTQKISAVGSAMGGKAVAAKDYMASKLGYGETTPPTPSEDNTNTNTKSSSSSPLEYGKKIAYTVTEKLKPGEEDRALSKVISEAFNRRKEESDFGQQQEPKGKVTESEELTRRLGKDDSKATEKSSAARTADAAGRSVVDMVKDTVGSWMGKAGDQSAPPSQQSLGAEGRRQQQEQHQGGTEAEVRRLQDSAN